MGAHLCEFCRPRSKGRFPSSSTGDVTLMFSSGRSWRMPDMILHYVADHRWVPPVEFVEDVMYHRLVGGRRDQTKGLIVPTLVGYLRLNDSSYVWGEVLFGFIEWLEILMEEASKNGFRTQYRNS